ncbi:16S rRNA (uracil(1498)-N(3))-methyltransferase [Cryptosporidium felis]|nr:16S rRNA (uracil(1498)-N(3))-methyltransferase [Cryptosporidium felis]
MNLIIIDPKDINEDLTIELSDRQSNHCISVLEVEVGSKLNVGVKNSGKGIATVIDIRKKRPENETFKELTTHERADSNNDSKSTIDSFKAFKTRKSVSDINLSNNLQYYVKIKLNTPIHKEPCCSNYPLVDLLVALPRPKVFEKIIQYAVTVGVGRIIFVCTEKTEKSYLNSSKMNKESIEKIVQLGLEQASVTLCPDIYVYASWKFCLQHLSNEVTDVGLQKHTGPIIIAIGPEGGWTENELNDLISEGFKVVNIGERILKVETAIISIHSKLRLISLVMDTSFLSSTSRDPINYGTPINTMSVDIPNDGIELCEDANLFLRLQNTKNGLLEESNEVKETENAIYNGYTDKTPMRKKVVDKESWKIYGDERFVTPKRYFNEDVLSTVPKNKGRIISNGDYLFLNENKSKVPVERITANRENVLQFLEEAIPNRISYHPKGSGEKPGSRSLITGGLKKIIIFFFSAACNFFFFQLPIALILYSISLYLLQGSNH